jgi:pilus assembly protein Flp/PilA
MFEWKAKSANCENNQLSVFKPNRECPHMKKFITDESGATAIEYGLIAAAMGLALVAAMPSLATNVKAKMLNLGGHIATGT